MQLDPRNSDSIRRGRFYGAKSAIRKEAVCDRSLIVERYLSGLGVGIVHHSAVRDLRCLATHLRWRGKWFVIRYSLCSFLETLELC